MEKRFVVYLLTTMLVLVFLFFAGTAPDVMQQDGWQWKKPPVEAAPEAHAAHG